MNRQDDDRARLSLRVQGRVQGVGFRFATRDEASRLALGGWVRNTPDGGVEVVAEGPTVPLRRLAAWCRVGPPGALVTDFDERWLPYIGEFDSFGIRR
ncbi:MAG: acylphosphatase [Candidatus Binatia bacterium]